MDNKAQGQNTDQVGLFALWPNARRQEQQVLDDLNARFDILGIYEIEWTPGLVAANYQRFYSDLQLRGVYHANRKGTGKFLAVPVRDPKPDFQQRMTSKGSRLVNANFLDAKMLYREWSDDLNVHCSETVTEANRDVTMLLGTNAADTLARRHEWSGKVVSLQRDITGAHGWDSLNHMFYVLNNAVNYVVLNSDVARTNDTQHAIELATDDYYGLHTLLSNRNYLPLLPEQGCSLPVMIAGQKRMIGLRYVGDRFIDPDWMQELLINRKLDEGGYYRADDANHFLVTAYCALALRRGPLNMREFLATAPPPSGSFRRLRETDSPAELQRLLRQDLQDRMINHPKPLDPTVCYNDLRTDMRSASDTLANWKLAGARIRTRCSEQLAAQYWRIRDGIIFYAPWISQARNALRSANN